METNEARKPYVPPKISRVVLRREQAVLSVCSASASTNGNSSTTSCISSAPPGCKKAAVPGDSAAQS